MKKVNWIYILLILNLILTISLFFMFQKKRHHRMEGFSDLKVPGRAFSMIGFDEEQMRAIGDSKRKLDSLNRPFAESRKAIFEKALDFDGDMTDAQRDSLIHINSKNVYHMQANLMNHFKDIYDIADDDQKQKLKLVLPQMLDRIAPMPQGPPGGSRKPHR